MAENKDNQLESGTGADIVDIPQAPSSDKSDSTLEEDFELLQRINVLKAVMVRMQGGRHPSPEIDALLQRRMNVPRDAFQGPYIVRLISTLMMVFVATTLCWGVLWILGTAFELKYFLRILSTGMATLVAAIAGVAIFHPSSLPDEKLLKEFIDNRLQEISKQVQQKSSKTNIQSSDQVADLSNSSVEAMTSPQKQPTKNDEQTFEAMSQTLNSISEQQVKLQNDKLPDENTDSLPASEKVEVKTNEATIKENGDKKE